MKDPGTTPPIQMSEDGKPLPNSISEVNFYKIGKIDQWAMIRGEDAISNPVLILLHGGPGFSETNLFRFHNADLERFFTVVYWDQRGSGKSFDSSIPKSTMNVNHFISDLDELIDTVFKRVRPKNRRVILLGHEWGSILGTLYTKRFPHKVAAYVGCGQMGDWQRSEEGKYKYLRERAEELQLTATLSELNEMGPPPNTMETSYRQRHMMSELEGKQTICARWDTALMNLFAPEGPSLWDFFSPSPDSEFSLDAMWDEISKIDLAKSVTKLSVPALFFLGRHDHIVPSQVSVDFINQLEAPSKKIVWFVKSGNSPFVEEAGIFNMSMVKLVRPLGM